MSRDSNPFKITPHIRSVTRVEVKPQWRGSLISAGKKFGLAGRGERISSV